MKPYSFLLSFSDEGGPICGGRRRWLAPSVFPQRKTKKAQRRFFSGPNFCQTGKLPGTKNRGPVYFRLPSARLRLTSGQALWLNLWFTSGKPPCGLPLAHLRGKLYGLRNVFFATASTQVISSLRNCMVIDPGHLRDCIKSIRATNNSRGRGI